MRSLRVGLTAALFLAVAVGSSGPAAAAETIRIGFMGPLTGIFAQAGKDMLDGLKMALEQVTYQLEKLGNILGFVAAYILGPDPAGRGVPPDLVPAVHELRASYTTRQRDMDPALTKRLGLFDYLRARLAIAGTPEDCVAQVRAAEAAGVTQLMFTVSLAADPERTVELFGKAVLPRLARA
jgi:alkanesulfonate monooxygenase SsuD/methylene tetrahydromethanopterin reductase-like flavin-dependent oxidoreductase (luciferase family)